MDRFRRPFLRSGLVLLVALVSYAAIARQPAPQAPAQAARRNPLLVPSTLPFQAPEFDKIQDSDFQPALEAGIRQELAEVRRIADNPAAPSFDNTIVALEKSGQLLSRVNAIFDGLTSANTDPELQKVQEAEAPKLAAAHDAIFLDDKLFKRVDAIYKELDSLKLDPESKRLVEYDEQHFVLAGSRLSPADKTKLKKLNEEDASLGVKFTNALLAATKEAALVVSDNADLAGLTRAELDAAAQAARQRHLDNRWIIPLQNTTQQPDLRRLTVRDTRRALFEASWTRAERGDANDTRAIVSRLAQVRAEAAKLLGYPNYAAWKLQDQMAKTPAAVDRFLDQLVRPATSRARAEAADLQAMIDQQHGAFSLEPWDWDFYAEQVRKAKYNLDQSQIRPYFELNRVLTDGVFYAAHQLYGVSFRERRDLPVYQKGVRVFEVDDKNGTPLGLFYADYFKRDNKSGGAWMNNFVGQSKLLATKPVIYNVANFPEPASGQPALLTSDDVVTMFHEFGHALHGFFADEEFPSLSGTNVARDFVEFPSQLNEHWAFDPAVLHHYAIHYETGQPMPQGLVDKIVAARDFNAGYNMTELLAAAELDMQWHSRPASAPRQDVNTFERAALKTSGVDLAQVPPRYRSSYFLHIWGLGYAAGYYAYLWTQMLADDAFAWFEAHGGLTRENGDRFRSRLLSRGDTQDYSKMYRDFTGRDPDIGPMLKYRGLSDR
jgi:peptidyl-dipeptidase Dcp